MTSPTPVGTAVVQIRAAVDKVKKDITDGVKEGWKAAERTAMAQGRQAGKKYSQGFNAGIKEGDIAGAIHRQFRASEREAGAAGARAGARYAAAFNQAAKSANPPTTEPNRPTPTRPPRTPNNGGNAGGGGGSPGAANADRAAQAVQRNTKSTHTIQTRLDNAATTILRNDLSAIQRSLMVIGLLSKGALVGIAAPAALSSVAAITSAVSALGGALALIPIGVNAIALPIAALKLGTSGIMDAFKASSEAGKGAEQTAKAVASAQKGVTAAQRGVVSAQRGIISSTQGVSSAERGVAAAIRSSERARDSLNDTIKNQIRQLRDLNVELKGSALDEEDATLAVARARERLANMPADSTALDYQEASLAIRQSQQRLDEVRISNADLRIDVKKANDEGVEGSNAVRDARQGVVDAVQGEADANQSLINAQQSLADSQQSLADANDSLAEAIQGVQDAANSGGVDKFAEAMGKLSANGKDFVTKVSGLSGAFGELKKQVQDPLFEGLGDDVVNLFKVFTDGENVLGNGLARISGGFNTVAKDAIKAFASPDSVEKFGFVIEQVGVFIEKMAPGVFALIGVFKNLAFVGAEFLPGFADGFTGVAQKMETWSQNLEHIRGIIRTALDVGKQLFGIFGTGIDIIKNVFSTALEPGERVLTVIGKVFDRIDGISSSEGGNNALKAFFENGATAIESLETALGDVILIIGDTLLTLSGFGEDIAPGLSRFIDKLREGLNNLQPAFDYLGPVISKLLTDIGEHLPRIGDVFAAVVVGMEPFISALTWIVTHGLPPLLWMLEKLAPIIGPLAIALTAMALGWQGVSLAMKGFKFFEDGIGGAMDKVKDKLRGQSDNTDHKNQRTTALNDTLDTLQTEEQRTEDVVRRTSTAVDDAAGEMDDLATAADNAAGEYAGFNESTRNAAPTTGRDLSANTEPPRNSRGFRTDPVESGDDSMATDRATARRMQEEAADAPARPRSRVASALAGGGKAGLGVGLVAATIGSALVSVGGEEGLAGTASLVTGTISALTEGDFTTALGNFGSLQEGVEGVTDGFGYLKDSMSGVGGVASSAFTTLKDSPKAIKSGFDTAKTAASTAGTAIGSAATSVKNLNIGTKIGAVLTKGMAIAQGVLNAVMRANPIGLLVTAIGLLIAGVVLAYQNSETFRDIVQSVWEAVKNAASIAWDWIGKIFDWIKVGFSAVGDAFMWVWNTLIQPAWELIKAGIQLYWDYYLNPIFEAIKAAFGLVGDMFSWVWNEVIKPAWNALGDGITWVWERVIQPAFNALKDGLTGVKDWFSSMVDTIGELWGRIVDIVKVPIRFVIDKVYNQGIVKAWNGIAGLIGMDDKKLNEMSLEGFATGGIPDRKKGGVESGYSPGRDDRVIAVGGGEAVMRPEWTRAVGSGYVNMANAAARNGGVRGVQSMLNSNPNMPRFALGGPVDPKAAPWAGGGGESNLQPAAILARRNIHKYWPEIGTIGGYRAQDAYPDHPSGLALDTMTGDPAGTQVNDWLHQQKDALALNYTIWKQFYKPAGGGGNMMEDRGDPTQNHMDHIHSLFNASGVAGIEAGGVGSDGSGGGGSLWDSIVGAVRGSAAWGFKNVMKPLRKLVETTTDLGGGLFGDVPLKMFDKMNGVAEAFISGKEGSGATSSNGSSSWEPSAGAQQWRQMMVDAYKNQGYESTPAKIDAWVRQIDTESGGDPGISQKITDVNGTGDAAGVGLGQMIPGTWAAYRDPALPDNRRDAWAMTNAMVRYGEQKFGGSLLDNIGQGHGYDNGGWLKPGLTLANNQSGVPEPVFTGGQWDVLKQGLNHGAGDEYLKTSLPALQTGMQDLAVDAFKETIIGGLFGEETFGLDGLINKAVDQAVADAAKNGNGFGQPPVTEGEAQSNAGIVAQEVNFYGMDPQKVNEEVQRAVGAGMTPVSGRYRAP